ncbi:RagB/SusD family nutrient uptake outer membrane protein [Sabulibacter ruber]|uniref:RagB/SusD family nutrient uptake outer membrane protein n=1 Tax=Sabulibacter ruber TaxID=2811901 RepID=UPI001A958000|nr:RagB/SusD family nutrient uptake outer membrane protein [Sabulibacter ruber]
MKKSFLYKINTIALAACISFSSISCDELIEINPETAIDASTALTTRENVEAAIIGVYVPLKGLTEYGNRLVTLPEALADNGMATGKSGRLVNEAANIRGAANHFTHWTTSYNAIARINYILDAIPTLQGATVTEDLKNSYIAELKFLRALYHFDLVRAYAYIPGAVVDAKNRGGVPVVTTAFKTPAAALEFKPSRPAIEDVYTAIYADLDDAIAKYGTGGAFSTPGRASKVAVQALYSRVALYRKDYPKVIEMSTAAIDTRGASLTNAGNYVAAWGGAVHPESIFEIQFSAQAESNGVNESLQTAFTTLVQRGNRNQTGGFGDLVPTPSLLSALGITVTGNGTANAAITARSSDVRNLLFELGTAGRGAPYVETTKFLGKSGFINVDNIPVIRIAEMYLNRAEAYANTAGGDVNALLDVNRIRTNRGLEPSLALGQDLKNEILLQRRLEFAFEGHRFFDLKRLGLDILKPATGATVAFTEDVILPAVPQADVDGNPNLKQNSGY